MPEMHVLGRQSLTAGSQFRQERVWLRAQVRSDTASGKPDSERPDR